MLLRLFLKGEGTNQKSENVLSSSLIRGTTNSKKVWVWVLLGLEYKSEQFFARSF